MFAGFIARLVGGPVLSAIASIAGAFLSFLAKVVVTALKGARDMPAAGWVTLGVVFLAGAGVGLRWGLKWDAHKVQKAVHLAEERTMERDDARKERDLAQAERNQWEGRFNEEKDEATRARKARDEAVARVQAEADARQRAVAAHARAERLRNGAGPGSPAKAAGPKDAPPAGLLGLPVLSW